jgi:hypothetical protein
MDCPGRVSLTEDEKKSWAPLPFRFSTKLTFRSGNSRWWPQLSWTAGGLGLEVEPSPEATATGTAWTASQPWTWSRNHEAKRLRWHGG